MRPLRCWQHSSNELHRGRRLGGPLGPYAIHLVIEAYIRGFESGGYGLEWLEWAVAAALLEGEQRHQVRLVEGRIWSDFVLMRLVRR